MLRGSELVISGQLIYVDSVVGWDSEISYAIGDFTHNSANLLVDLLGRPCRGHALFNFSETSSSIYLYIHSPTPTQCTSSGAPAQH